mmetsp:Transcript_24627/g.58588  ORF Transcript_24627/g.58588 Transcript_24627/m.58588 type:complete len:235 (-) Transcript_24627:396-1100(-)
MMALQARTASLPHLSRLSWMAASAPPPCASPPSPFPARALLLKGAAGAPLDPALPSVTSMRQWPRAPTSRVAHIRISSTAWICRSISSSGLHSPSALPRARCGRRHPPRRTCTSPSITPPPDTTAVAAVGLAAAMSARAAAVCAIVQSSSSITSLARLDELPAMLSAGSRGVHAAISPKGRPGAASALDPSSRLTRQLDMSSEPANAWQTRGSATSCFAAQAMWRLICHVRDLM